MSMLPHLKDDCEIRLERKRRRNFTSYADIEIREVVEKPLSEVRFIREAMNVYLDA
jgi:hypothetical protein